MTDTWNRCRFCKQGAYSLLKYGTRHYAHPRCYLDAGKSLSNLPAWRVVELPYFLLKEKGLLEQASAIAAKHGLLTTLRDFPQ